LRDLLGELISQAFYGGRLVERKAHSYD
jgi:hypothetical protein